MGWCWVELNELGVECWEGVLQSWMPRPVPQPGALPNRPLVRLSGAQSRFRGNILAPTASPFLCAFGSTEQ